MRFVIQGLKYDTDKMKKIANVKKWYKTNSLLVKAIYGNEEVGTTYDCELWRSEKGNWLLTHTEDYNTKVGHAITEEEVITRSNGLCERCKARGIYKPGYIVHHKEYITPGNISNPNITLNLDNLEYVCEDCHNKEHKAVHTPMRYQYDANGNLLPPKENNKSDHTPGVQNLTPGKRTEGVTSKKLRKVARI